MPCGPSFFEPADDIGPRCAQRGGQAEQKCGRERYGQGTEQHTAVELRGGHVPGDFRGNERPDKAASCIADAYSREEAERAKQHALREQLTDEPAATRADRQAHGDFPAPSRRARQQKVGDVGARDCQYQRDDGQQNGASEYESACAARIRIEFVRDRPYANAMTPIGCWIFSFKRRRYGLEIGLRALGSRARGEPPHCVEQRLAAVRQGIAELGRKGTLAHGGRQPRRPGRKSR